MWQEATSESAIDTAHVPHHSGIVKALSHAGRPVTTGQSSYQTGMPPPTLGLRTTAATVESNTEKYYYFNLGVYLLLIPFTTWTFPARCTCRDGRSGVAHRDIVTAKKYDGTAPSPLNAFAFVPRIGFSVECLAFLLRTRFSPPCCSSISHVPCRNMFLTGTTENTSSI